MLSHRFARGYAIAEFAVKKHTPVCPPRARTFVCFAGILILVFVGSMLFELATRWKSLKGQWATARERQIRESAARSLENRMRVITSEEPPKRADTREFDATRHRDRIARALAGSSATVVPIGTVEEFGRSWV